MWKVTYGYMKSGAWWREGGTGMVVSVKRYPMMSRKLIGMLLALLMLLFGAIVIGQGLYFPQLSENGLRRKNGATVDVGHADQGYIQVQYRAGSKRIKVRISRDDHAYTYDLNQQGEFEVFPLQMGSGNYQVKIYEQVKGTKYSAVSSVSFRADMENDMLPYLYPNQYVSFEPDSPLVVKAQSLCDGASGDREKAQRIEEYVSKHFMYDYIKSLMLTGSTTYLPDLDEVFSAQKGICFDLASLVCAMLRSQGVPTQMVFGYADERYHAWDMAYVDGQWQRIDVTATVTGTLIRQYRAERQY